MKHSVLYFCCNYNFKWSAPAGSQLVVLLQSADLKTVPLSSPSTPLISLNVVYRVLSDQPTTAWCRTVHVLRSCRCLIITAHLLIRAARLACLTNVLVTASLCKKERGEKCDQTWLVITIIVPSLQSDLTTFISMHILHQTEQLHVWAWARRALQLEASRSQIQPANYLEQSFALLIPAILTESNHNLLFQ